MGVAYLATHHQACCAQAVKHEGTAQGEFIEIGGIQTYISYAPGKSVNRVLLYYADLYGPRYINNQLMMDWFAEHGYTVLSLDYFEGEEFEHLLPQEGFDMHDWIPQFREAAPGLVKDVWLPAVRSRFPAKYGYAAVGHCFGAPMVIQDLTTGQAAAGAIAHPSSLTVDHFQGVVGPLFLSCAETDPVFGPEFRHKAEAIAILGMDVADPCAGWAKEESAWSMLDWFDRFLGCR